MNTSKFKIVFLVLIFLSISACKKDDGTSSEPVPTGTIEKPIGENESDINESENSSDEERAYTLLEAVKYGKIDTAKELIQKGEGLDVIEHSSDGTFNKFSLFGIIIRQYRYDNSRREGYFNNKGYLELAKLMIKYEANLDFKDEYGNTPLKVACDSDALEIARLLLDSGTDHTVKDNFNETLLHSCTDINILKELIDLGLDVNARTDIGDSPLHHQASNPEVMKVLISNGADINSIGFWDRTPIFYVHDEEIIRILVESGADVAIKDYSGNNPILYHASRYSKLKNMDDYKAMLYLTDYHFGQLVAKNNENKDIIDYLEETDDEWSKKFLEMIKPLYDLLSDK
jgi:hypothetical protein